MIPSSSVSFSRSELHFLDLRKERLPFPTILLGCDRPRDESLLIRKCAISNSFIYPHGILPETLAYHSGLDDATLS